jgi:checkpoint serine/threonine-protein kinase
MTMHTKAATDEIYELFNAPIKATGEDIESDDDEYMTDGDYTSGAESTGTTRQVGTSEAGDDETADDKSVSEWSDFTARKHIPKVSGESELDRDGDSEMSDLIETHDVHPSDHEGDGDEHTKNASDSFPPTPEDSPPRSRTRFIPIPPEDYEPPTRPYRDPVEVANNRLPFMTPITERTETSLGMTTEAKLHLFTKTPSKLERLDTATEEREEDDEDFEPLSSPLREVSNDILSPVKLAQPQLPKPKPATTTSAIPKGPIIKEAQCNPVDTIIRDEILTKMHPPLISHPGFYDHRNERCDRGPEIRKFAKIVGKAGKSSNEKTGPIHSPVILEFPELMCEYILKKELGAGAFAPVYLVENSSPEDGEVDGIAEMGKGAFATRQRASLETLKMEQPPSAWEFHMMRLAADRLGPHHRATASISAVHELHLYQDEGFMVLPYHPHGTLLHVVNSFRETAPGTMDEALAMFFTIELLRTVEALHAKQILHGDLKVDNCMLRLDDLSLSHSQSQSQLSTQWYADGSGGWSTRGVVLIDFGRGIDMRAFEKDVQFIADWKTGPADCAEMREGRPWTWQIDYHGLAGIVHCLLFGRYIETVRADQGGLGTAAGRRYKIRESLKRYWQTDLWAECFDVLLNPGSHVEGEAETRMPVNRSLRRVRERMEVWLEANCEKGIGLRAMMARLEEKARSKWH